MATDNLSERLKRLRNEAGWSQEALARMVNDRQGSTWRQSTVWKIENGSRPLTLADAEALAHVFRMSLEDLLYGDDEWDSTAEAPIEDPRHRMRLDVLDGRLTALHFERQALLVRLAEIDAEIPRVQGERDGFPGDIDSWEGDK